MGRLEVNEWVEKEEQKFLCDIMELIKIPSVSLEDAGDGYLFGKPCHDVLEKVLDICARSGFIKGQNHEDYCATILWEGECVEEIGIFSHLDVVPEGSGWQFQPYQPIVQNGLLIGRGSSDNKGPAMAVLYALKYLKETGWKPKHSIRMFFGSNEECGMKDVTYFTENFKMPVFSFTPDAAFPVCHGEKGVLELEAVYDLSGSVVKEFCSGVASNAVPSDAYTVLELPIEKVKGALKGQDCIVRQVESGTEVVVTGVAAHAAFPEGSQSAEVKLAIILKESALLDETAMKWVASICSLFGDYYGSGIGIPYQDEVSGKLTHVGGMVRMKDGIICQNINIRYPISSNQDIMMDTMKRRLLSCGFQVTKVRNNPPCYMDADIPVIQKLTEICNRHLNMSSKPYVMGGGTYARKLKYAIGYGPGIPGEQSVFGPDRGKGHQPDEYIRVDKLKQAVEIYVEAIQAIDVLV